MPRRNSYSSVRPVIRPIDGSTEGARGELDTGVHADLEEIASVVVAQEDQEISSEAVSVTQADAHRTMPRAANDNVDESIGNHLKGEGEVVTSPSIYSHRMNRRNSNRGLNKFTRAEQRDLQTFLNPQTDRERALRQFADDFAATGESPETLSRRKRAYIRRLDRAIQKAESENDRMHVVNMPLELDSNSNREEFLQALQGNPGIVQTFNGFSRGNQDINKITTDDAEEIIVQLETSRGMYLGARGGSSHLLPRGLRASFVAVREMPIQRPDGTTYRRTIVQLRELPTEEN